MYGYLANIPDLLAEQSIRQLEDSRVEFKQQFHRRMLEAGIDKATADRVWLQMATKEIEGKIDNAS